MECIRANPLLCVSSTDIRDMVKEKDSTIPYPQLKRHINALEIYDCLTKMPGNLNAHWKLQFWRLSDSELELIKK